MSKGVLASGAALIFTCVAATPAAALSLGFDLYIITTTATGDYPTFRLDNVSAAGVGIRSINFTIGNPAYRFDRITNRVAPAGGVSTLTFGGTANDLVGTDSFTLTFTDFDAGEFATWRAEIDPDGSSSDTLDYRTIFFNNGVDIANATMTVAFTDDRTLELTATGIAGETAYSFGARQNDIPAASDVPLPAALPLLGAGLAGLGLIARRRRA